MERNTTQASVNTIESQSVQSSSSITIVDRNSISRIDPSDQHRHCDDEEHGIDPVPVSQDENDNDIDTNNQDTGPLDRRRTPIDPRQGIVDEKNEERYDGKDVTTTSNNNNNILLSMNPFVNESKSSSSGNSTGSGLQDQYVTKTSDDDDLSNSKIPLRDRPSNASTREVGENINLVDTSRSGVLGIPTTADIPPTLDSAVSSRAISGSVGRYPLNVGGGADTNYSQYGFNADQGGDRSSGTESLLQLSGIATQVEAELVVEPSPLLRSNTIMNAHVQVAPAPILSDVIQGEIIDDEFIQRMRQQHLGNDDEETGDNKATTSNDESTPSTKKLKRRYIVVALIGLITVIIVIVIAVIVASKGKGNTSGAKTGGANTSDTSNRTSSDVWIPYTGTDTIYKYPIITQHAVIVQTRVDCQSIVSLSPPYNSIEITCGNGYEADGSEAIELVSSSLLDCVRVQDNVIQCQSNLKQSGTTFSSAVFRCGINHTVTDTNQNQQFFVATVSTLPLYGITCASDPEIQVGMYRFCKAPVTSSTVPAVLSTVQPINQEQYCGVGTLVQRDTSSLCGSTGVYDCDSYSSVCGSKIREIAVYDPYVNESSSTQCEIDGPADGLNSSVAQYLPSSITTSILIDQIHTSFVSFRD